MSERFQIRHKKTGQITTTTEKAFDLLKNSYDRIDGGTITTSIIKKKEGAVADVEDEALDQARNDYEKIFGKEPDKRKKLQSILEDIKNFNGEE